jgi:hypothetical protein
MFALAACGDSLPGAPDAAPPPDANPSALVKVRYSTNGSFENGGTLSPAGRRVYFVNPSGSLALVTATDGAGIASARLPEGGTIVLLDSSIIYVYVSAHGGDEIQIGPGTAEPALSMVETLHLTLSQQDGIDRFLMHSTCPVTQGGVLSAGANPNITDVSPAVDVEKDFQFLNCDPDALQDLLLTTVDFNNVPIGYRYFPSRSFDNATSSNTIVMHDDDNYFTVSSHLLVSNIASSVESVLLSQQLWGRAFVTSTDEVFFNSFQTPVNGVVDALLPIPTPTGATLVTHVTEQSNTKPMVQSVVKWEPASSETTLDFGGVGIAPLLTAARMDYSTLTFRWDDTPTPAGDPSRPDTVLITMFTNGGINFNTIKVLAPYTVDETGAGSVALPKVSELLTSVLSSQPFAPGITKLRLGDHTARQQLLLTGLDAFPIDGASGQVNYEAPQPFGGFPD